MNDCSNYGGDDMLTVKFVFLIPNGTGKLGSEYFYYMFST